MKTENLSRRALLAWLPVLGVGCAAAMTLGVRELDAAPVTNAAGKAKDLADNKVAEDKKAELVDGRDPDDAVEFSAQTPGMTRRQTRRVVRRERRETRRTARRVRRATRRGAPVE